MISLNNILWALSVALQCLLFSSLLMHGIVRRLPVFTLLVGFYVLRSILLFALFGHLSPSAYTFSYTVLSLFDVLLQVAVAWELFSDGRHPTPDIKQPAPLLRSLAVFCGLAIVSAGVAWGFSILVPADPRARIDRGVLFTSTLMLSVFAASAIRPTSTCRASRRVLEGFAALGVISILSQVARTVAGLHRNATAFTRWSYAGAAAYLVVLLFWLLTLRNAEPRARANGTSLSLLRWIL